MRYSTAWRVFMGLPRAFIVIVIIVLSGLVAFAAAPPEVKPLLPKQFGGWQSPKPVQASADRAAADPVNAALLKEYGFTDFESGAYVREDGRKLTVKAARFQDASGAYGAFTYYKMPVMLNEKIGDQGASLNERVLFYRGNILVDAVFQQLTAMSAAELRELADSLPLPAGNARNLPGLPLYLPKQSYVKNTARYIVGPVGLGKLDAPLSAEFVDFGSSAEVVLGNYNTSAGEATLMLISYPTPQIAAAHLRRIDAEHQSPAPQAPNADRGTAGPIYDRRTGPILAIVTGPISATEAKSLLASVNYEADVTWNENTYLDKKNNVGTLVWNSFMLAGILIGFALVIGLAFGGARVVLARIFPHRIFDRPGSVEFIALHLDESREQAPDSRVSTSIKAI